MPNPDIFLNYDWYIPNPNQSPILNLPINLTWL